jgi:hypothetical protein
MVLGVMLSAVAAGLALVLVRQPNLTEELRKAVARAGRGVTQISRLRHDRRLAVLGMERTADDGGVAAGTWSKPPFDPFG